MRKTQRWFRHLTVIAALAVPTATTAADFAPFIQIATVPAVWRDGSVDAQATYERAHQVAVTIATFVARQDESQLGLTESNWALAGAPEGDAVTSSAIASALLDVPTPWPIDPNQPLSSANTKKVNLLEVCNRELASKALGAAPVIGETFVANGPLHATALPCEVAVYADEYDIKIEMLNAEAIFSLFFTDVLFGPQMQDPDFAAALQRLPALVNSELPAIVYRALSDSGITFWSENWQKGPWFQDQWDMIYALISTPLNSPYMHLTYRKLDHNAPFSDDEVALIAQTLIDTLTINGQAGAGVHDDALEEQLSPGSQWRAARSSPLSVPGNAKIVEACSPLYAKQAMGTGLHHATALPCEIAVTKSADGSQLVISFLDPHFMFNALFADAFDGMTADQLNAFAALPGAVLNDLRKIVDYTLGIKMPDLGIQLAEPVSLHQDMLPF